MPTLQEIDAAKTKKGGWSRAQLAAWGVSWPPPKGWRQRLASGEPLPVPSRDTLEPSPIRPSVPAHDLLCKVVGAVIANGHASDLYEFPDVLAYFGSQMPEETEGLFGPTTEAIFNPPRP